ncbi:glutathione peroxidase [Motiliproteus sp. SC1-56]|uniref:glutathione peroxidase n=1 Tax=Motiliproteus sp. SC1-56 TaxID=2799565 RepID=UPI001A908147|nr:glutathione peroxidase [Motiliproteus sp. SC1-56]
MRNQLMAMITGLGLLLSQGALAESSNCPPLLDHSFRPLAGDASQRLCEVHRGKVVLVVNTASECGYTYQYAGLEHLYERFREQGFVIIGFPSDDFGGQEPGGEEEIKQFCRDTYSVQFPMYEKTHAAQSNAHPFFRDLGEAAGQYPQWNFHKYLLDRQGRVVGSWRSAVEPESQELVRTIKRYL